MFNSRIQSPQPTPGSSSGSAAAARQFCFLPVRIMLRDAWDNVETLKHYAGPVDIFGASGDTIIPIEHARALARQIPGAHFTAIPGGHHDWSGDNRVNITR